MATPEKAATRKLDLAYVLDAAAVAFVLGKGLCSIYSRLWVGNVPLIISFRVVVTMRHGFYKVVRVQCELASSQA